MTANARAASVVVSLFVALLAGPNLVVPLFPHYDRALGLGASGVAVMFNSYLLTLICVLLVLARPSLQQRPLRNLMIGATTGVVSSLVLALETFPALILGRALGGLAVGLSTGAAAVIIYRLLGERGRTTVATTYALGGATGVLFGAIGLDLTGSGVVVYLSHAVLMIVIAPLVLLSVRAAKEPPAVSAQEHAAAVADLPPRWVGFLIGCLAWGGGGMAMAFLPRTVDLVSDGAPAVQSSAGVALLFAAAVVGQSLLYRPQARRSTAWGALALVIGAGMLIVFTLFAVPVGVILAAILIGIGQGIGYRVGLRIISRSASSTRQGAGAAGFAAACYGAAVAMAFVGGAASDLWGAVTGMVVMSSVIIAGSIIALLIVAPRRRPTRS